MFFIIPWATGIGAYTLTAKWHRLSDTIGADLIALALGSVAALLLLRAGRIERAPQPRVPVLRVLFVVGLAAFAATTAALGTLLAVATRGMSPTDAVVEWDTYLVATTLAASASLTCALAYWASWC